MLTFALTTIIVRFKFTEKPTQNGSKLLDF